MPPNNGLQKKLLDNVNVDLSSRAFLSRIDRFNIDIPWSPHLYYYSVRGAENFHIYLWILKDLGWTQGWVTFTLTFGYAALGWCLVLLFHAIRKRNYEDFYMLFPLTLWLFGNFWWMFGEEVNHDDDVHAPQSGYIFISALAMIALYHAVLRPLKLIVADEDSTIRYGAAGLYSRFSYFENWRQYEHAHTFFWLGKDYSWCAGILPLWIIFLIPTVLCSADFVYVTFKRQWMMIDCAHYCAQFMWVMGNMCWALGELCYSADDDSPQSMWISTSYSRSLFRWWSSWLLFAAFFPILALYFIWLPLTCLGLLRPIGDADGLPLYKHVSQSAIDDTATGNENNSELDGSPSDAIDKRTGQ